MNDAMPPTPMYDVNQRLSGPNPTGPIMPQANAMSAGQEPNKMVGGLPMTQEALQALGAGQPYKSEAQ